MNPLHGRFVCDGDWISSMSCVIDGIQPLMKRCLSVMGRWVLVWAISVLGAHSSLANDDASNYSSSGDNWVSDAHRGTYDSAEWELEAVAHAGFAGHFIGDSALGGGDINVDGKSFGLFAHPSGDPNPFAAAVKRFAKPVLTTGDTISFQVSVNFRDGSKGFNLRSADGTTLWLFFTSSGGYYIRNGTSQQASTDDGQSMGGYASESIFTFTFTQHERHMDWTIERSGGIQATVSDQVPIESGTMADVRFFISGAGHHTENNIYFNSFTIESAPRENAPLTLGERRFPGYEPSYFLRFQDPQAGFVNFRSENDWDTSYPLTDVGGGVYELDIRTVGLDPGFHQFKFRMEGGYESGPNRRLYIREDGMIAKPPAIYLTWQQDPTSTMTIQWHTYDPSLNEVRWRPVGATGWTTLTADSTHPFPYSERYVHWAEITGLDAASDYEFEVDGYTDTYSFRTMPADLSEPVTAAFTGDVLYGEVADQMAETVAALDPAFLMVGGDLAYSDGRADLIFAEYMYFESFYSRFRAPDGRLIPLIVGPGNHEMRNHYITWNPMSEDSDEWRARIAPYFYPSYAFPGQPGYATLDFGDYLSLVILDTDHMNAVEGVQTDWLADRLNERREVRHLIPIMHVPAYPSHRSSQGSLNTKIRDLWLPLFESAGVHLVFEHHDHTFKRTPPLLDGEIDADGIVFLGDGAWGVGIRSVKDPEGRTDLQRTESIHHAYIATFSTTGRHMRAVNVNGDFFDAITQIADGIPPAPAGLQTERVTSVSAEFSWDPTPRAQSYRVIRAGVDIGTTSAPHFVDETRTPNSSVDYVVHAINRSGESVGSAPLTITTTATPASPSVPGGLQGDALSPSSVALSWATVPHAYSYEIQRDGATVATNTHTTFFDGGRSPETTYTYAVRAVNVSGESAWSGTVSVQTPAAWPGFTLDGQAESPNYLLSQPAMQIFAAVRGTELYVATWTPAGGDSDHFIFVTDELLPRATRRAPWNKKGFLAMPSGKPYLGAESTTSDFVGWFNAPASAQAFRSGTGGEQIEGVIDLVETFGYLPEFIYIASAAYGTASLNSLTSQGPLGNGDENIYPNEFLVIPVEAIRDNEGIGFYARLDPERGFAVDSARARSDEPFELRWLVVPNAQYHVWRASDLRDDSTWENLTAGAPITIPSGYSEWTFADPDSDLLAHAFYWIEIAE